MNNGFTWRARLADWLTGGAYSLMRQQRDRAHGLAEKASNAALSSAESYRVLADKVARGFPTQEGFGRKVKLVDGARLDESLAALRAIRAATKDGKSGTARKIARMAEEALK